MREPPGPTRYATTSLPLGPFVIVNTAPCVPMVSSELNPELGVVTVRAAAALDATNNTAATIGKTQSNLVLGMVRAKADPEA